MIILHISVPKIRIRWYIQFLRYGVQQTDKQKKWHREAGGPPKNHTHMKKVGHTSEFLFGIYWWTWKTTLLKNCRNGPIKNVKILIFETGLSMNILLVGDKSPVQRSFFKNSKGNLFPTLKFLGGLYTSCNFVIIFF